MSTSFDRHYGRVQRGRYLAALAGGTDPWARGQQKGSTSDHQGRACERRFNDWPANPWHHDYDKCKADPRNCNRFDQVAHVR